MDNATYQMDMLEFAGNMLDHHNLLDANAPTLLDVTGISQHGMATFSGLKDYDYQSLSTLSMGHTDLIQLATVNKVPIPPEVMEHFKHIKCHCVMGLFAEIGRAWLTIDSDIYIWTYENSRDVAYFDGLNHLIVSVGIVKPKPGVFVDDIKYLLILTTPVEIVILGVTFGDSTKLTASPIRSTTYNREEMQLINKPIFLLNTDSVAITTIEGTDDGRIFLGGRDGCLYEIYYQAESNWFGKRCKKVNHSQGLISYMVPGFLKAFSEVDPIIKLAIDNSRKLLYVLTEKGSIEAWDLGNDYTSIRRISRLTQNDICHQAGNILKSIDETIFKPITSIFPLLKSDSPYLNLLGVTQCGVRFYFSTTSFQQQMQNQPINEPIRSQNLYLLHIRMPPGYTPNTTVGKPKNIHSAFHSQGTVLMISNSQQDKDVLWSFSSEPFPLRQYLIESTTIMSLDGQVWAIAEVNSKPVGNLKDINVRNARTPKHVVLLTNQGAHIVALLKPVDILKQILMNCHGPQHDAVKAYFQIQTEPQACATSVLMACMESFRGSELSIWATQAFFLYGGVPHLDTNTSNIIQDISNRSYLDNMGTQPVFMSTPYASNKPISPLQHSNSFQRYNSGRNLTANFGNTNAQHDFKNMTYSAKHTGLYLYLSRLLRPIWKLKCVDENFNSTITREDCNIILDDLYAFKRFLETNQIHNIPIGQDHRVEESTGYQFEVISPTPLHGMQKRSTRDEMFAEEKHSLESLIRFIKHTCEVMALWKILCEHQIQNLIQAIPKEQQSILSVSIFRDLILFRLDICALLIVALINSYLNDNASLGSISSKLRDVCPSLYRHEDAVSHKATEILLLSKHSQDSEDKAEKLRTALSLCKDAAPHLPLSSICQQFIATEFYEGVIELCVTCASKLDPNDAALHYNKNQDEIEDQEGFIAYTSRMNCYKEVKIMLEKIYQNAINSAVVQRENNIQNECNDEEYVMSKIILPVVAIALQTNDMLLHYSVYEWLLSHQLLGRLLGISEPTLGSYLTQAVVKNPENLVLTDLLWKYYERNLQHAAAAKILDNLASTQSNSISLNQRFEYLARAVMCMRNDNIGSSAHNGVLLKDLEDKLEIARVQKLVLESLNNLKNVNANVTEAIRKLNYALYNISELYSEFAEQFDLWECKLTILNCSHHNDSLLIESVWMNILDKEMRVPGTPDEKSFRIISKVKHLAREHGTTGQCFPLTFLVRELEIRCCKLKLGHYPVPNALLEMNLDIGILLDIYSRIISLNERIWGSLGDECYLIKSVENFTSSLTRQPNLITKNRRKIVSKIQDLTSASLTLLYNKPDKQGLINSLRDIQTRSQRIAT